MCSGVVFVEWPRIGSSSVIIGFQKTERVKEIDQDPTEMGSESLTTHC
jgi:hypothetical protein